MDDVEANYLRRHLLYEVAMLEYTHGEMLKSRNNWHYNAMYESFVIHARNLLDFLRGKGNENTVTAKHYVSDFAFEGWAEVGPLYGRLHKQVLHMGRDRSEVDEDNINIAELGPLRSVIVRNFHAFRNELFLRHDFKLVPLEPRSEAIRDAVEKHLK